MRPRWMFTKVNDFRKKNGQREIKSIFLFSPNTPGRSDDNISGLLLDEYSM